MNTKKATKRALLTSVMALVMCVVMLVGTTFAWFTDTASTGVNKIQAGNLDVKLSYLTKENVWQEVTEITKLFDDEALWEPGHTEVAYLMVENVGNLALKYQLSVNVANEVTSTSVIGNTLKLSDYIKMGVVDGQTEAFTNREAARGAVQNAGNIATYTKNGNIAAGGGAQYVAMVVYMPETVGNEANYAVGKTIPSIELGVKLFATQDTVEFDSFNNQYDAGADVDLTTSATINGQDYASMQEVIRRRLNRYFEEKDQGDGFGRLPDLILLDGGKGHVAAVLPVIAEFGLSIPVFGMVLVTTAIFKTTWMEICAIMPTTSSAP